MQTVVSCDPLAASANQMISGSVVIFAAILSKLFLDRQLNKLHYAGCAWSPSTLNALRDKPAICNPLSYDLE